MKCNEHDEKEKPWLYEQGNKGVRIFCCDVNHVKQDKGERIPQKKDHDWLHPLALCQHIETKLTGLEGRLANIETKLTGLEGRLANIETRLAKHEDARGGENPEGHGDVALDGRGGIANTELVTSTDYSETRVHEMQ